jgi:hypothetical protein
VRRRIHVQDTAVGRSQDGAFRSPVQDGGHHAPRVTKRRR